MSDFVGTPLIFLQFSLISNYFINIHESCADPGNFVRGGGGGGGPGQSDKKALTTVFFFFFLSPQLIFTEVKWSISKKSIIVQGFRGGPTFSRGGGGGGVSNFFQLLIPYRNPYNL